MRTLAAMAIAPLAVIPVLVVLFAPWALAHGGTRSLTDILTPATALSYAMTILIGLPMHFMLIRQRRVRRRDYAITGALLGAVPVFAYYLVAVAFESRLGIVSSLMRNAEWGAIGVVVFGTCSAAVALAFTTLVRLR